MMLPDDGQCYVRGLECEKSLFLIHFGRGCWGYCFNRVPWNNLTLISRKY